MNPVTCFGITLVPKRSEMTGVTTLIGWQDNLKVTIGPSGLGGWYGYLTLHLPIDFYSVVGMDDVTLPPHQVHDTSPEAVARKLELFGRLLLPHFERCWPSAWSRLVAEEDTSP